jgi:hypothetical protein
MYSSIRIIPLHRRFEDYAEVVFDDIRVSGVPCRLAAVPRTMSAMTYGGGSEITVVIGLKEYESDMLKVFFPGEPAGRRLSIDDLTALLLAASPVPPLDTSPPVQPSKPGAG